MRWVDKVKNTRSSTENTTDIIRTKIREMIDSNPCCTQRDIMESLREHGIQKSLSTITRTLKGMNYTRKVVKRVPINRNIPSTRNRRQEYAREVDSIREDDILFLDEFGFNLYCGPRYGYSIRNTLVYCTVPNSKWSNVSLMCLISNKGVVAHETKIGAYRSVDFLAFINEKIQRTTLTKYIVMDNASIHHDSEVVAALGRLNHTVKFLPPYTPQLNPIEEYFHVVKAEFRNIIPRPQTVNDVKNMVDQLLRNDTTDMTGFYRDMRRYIQHALTRNEF